MTKRILFALLALLLSASVLAQHDQYGRWKKSDAIFGGGFYLKSTSSYQNDDYEKPVTLIIAGGNQIMLKLEQDCSFPEIGKMSVGEIPIVELEMSFDNGEYNYFNFFKLGNTLSFMVYDRIRGTEDHNATNMIKQMANKRTLSIRYRLENGSTRTQTFNLEGLEALLDVMYQ